MSATTATIGTRVSYEDMANPRQVGTVAEIDESRWGTQYRVQWDDDDDTTGDTWSDLRQNGWQIIAADHSAAPVKQSMTGRGTCRECGEPVESKTLRGIYRHA